MKRRRTSMLVLRLTLYAVVIVAGVMVGGFFGGLQVGVCAMAATVHAVMWFTPEPS